MLPMIIPLTSGRGDLSFCSVTGLLSQSSPDLTSFLEKLTIADWVRPTNFCDLRLRVLSN